MIGMRYDEARGIYRDCRFCGGRGCLYCPAEADKAYKAAFPEGAKPLATFKLSDFEKPGGLEAIRKAIGADAITKAFAPGGGGMAEVEANIKEAADKGIGEQP
jgi:hypothetical protein